MNGLLNINKPLGITSHDVVSAVRRMAHIRRVGHTGTLDPLATGVLVVLTGYATRLSRFVSRSNKTYQAIIRFGQATTTYDTEGEVTEQQAVPLTRADIETALEQFRGDIQQVPPMYSAIRFKGKKLYELARQGKEIARPPRRVTIHRLEILDWTKPDLTVDITCSAGTYIRSLAHDLGKLTECGAHLRALIRTATGPFRLETSHTLEELRALAAESRLTEALLPPQAALYSLPVVSLNPEQVQAARHGRNIALPSHISSNPPQKHLEPVYQSALQAHDEGGQLVAVLIPVGEGVWRPKIVLNN